MLYRNFRYLTIRQHCAATNILGIAFSVTKVRLISACHPLCLLVETATAGHTVPSPRAKILACQSCGGGSGERTRKTMRICVGMYLPQSVFTHGQLYVAMSRVKSNNCLQFALAPPSENSVVVTRYTNNVVFKSALVL